VGGKKKAIQLLLRMGEREDDSKERRSTFYVAGKGGKNSKRPSLARKKRKEKMYALKWQEKEGKNLRLLFAGGGTSLVSSP